MVGLKLFKLELLWSGILFLVYSVTQLLAPVLLEKLILHLEKVNSPGRYLVPGVESWVIQWFCPAGLPRSKERY